MIGLESELWPYILPLPPLELYDILDSVFRSKISFKIMILLAPEEKTSHKEILEKLKTHSNKSITEKLKKLVVTGVLHDRMEKGDLKDRVVWRKFYEPTYIGIWMLRLLHPPKSIPKEKVKEILKEAYTIYTQKILKLAEKYSVPHSTFEEIFKASLIEKTSK